MCKCKNSPKYIKRSQDTGAEQIRQIFQNFYINTVLWVRCLNLSKSTVAKIYLTLEYWNLKSQFFWKKSFVNLAKFCKSSLFANLKETAFYICFALGDIQRGNRKRKELISRYGQKVGPVQLYCTGPILSQLTDQLCSIGANSSSIPPCHTLYVK